MVDRCTIGVTSTHTCHGRDMPSAAAAHPPGLHFPYLTLYGEITSKAIGRPLRAHQSSPDQTLAPGLSSQGAEDRDGHLQQPDCPRGMPARTPPIYQISVSQAAAPAATSQLQSDQQPYSTLPLSSVQCLNLIIYYGIVYVVNRPRIGLQHYNMTYDILHGYNVIEDHPDIDTSCVDRRKDSVMRATLSTSA